MVEARALGAQEGSVGVPPTSVHPPRPCGHHLLGPMPWLSSQTKSPLGGCPVLCEQGVGTVILQCAEQETSFRGLYQNPNPLLCVEG